MAPQSRNITLGQNASFYCNGIGMKVQWYVEILESIVPPTEYTDRGFVFEESIEGTEHNLTVTIPGTTANNGTELWCAVTGDSSALHESNNASLIVIGKGAIERLS